MPPTSTGFRDERGDAVVQVALGPGAVPSWMADAVVAGGGQVGSYEEASALVWADAAGVDTLAEVLDQHPHIDWVQLPWAGVEHFTALFDDRRTWTCGKGVYAEPVAELALAMMLAGLRNVVGYSRASTWQSKQGRSLLGAHVTVLGGGGITTSLVRLLQPFECRITVVRRTVSSMDGVDDVVGPDRLVDALAGADVVVLALALTPDTEGIISRDTLEMMEPHAWLVNVARGRHVVTDDLVWALTEGVIGGAALDVTEPEPLPDGHPLWSMPNCLITPHTGNTDEMGDPLLAERITANVRRYAAGEPLLGPVDADEGY